MSHTIHSLQEVFGTVVSAYQQNQSDEPEVEETSDEQITKQVGDIALETEEEDEAWLDEDVDWIGDIPIGYEFPTFTHATGHVYADRYSLTLYFDKPITEDIMPKAYDRLFARSYGDLVTVFLPFLQKPEEPRTEALSGVDGFVNYRLYQPKNEIYDARFGEMGAMLDFHFANDWFTAGGVTLALDRSTCQSITLSGKSESTATSSRYMGLQKEDFCDVCPAQERVEKPVVRTEASFNPETDYLVEGIEVDGRSIVIRTSHPNLEVRHEVPYTDPLMEGLTEWQGQYEIERKAETGISFTTNIEGHKNLDDQARYAFPVDRPVRKERHIWLKLTNGAWLADTFAINTASANHDFIERVEYISSPGSKEVIVKVYLPHHTLTHDDPIILDGDMHFNIFESEK
jgi:hypothetical protein